MKTVKVLSSAKAIRFKSLHSKYLVPFLSFILLISLLSVNTVMAKTMTKNKSYLIEAGYIEYKTRADFSQAAQAYNNEDYVYAARLLGVLAKQGHSKAQYLLATQYDAGLGVTGDKEIAFYLYHQSAQSGLQAAHHNLAVSYAKGHGTKVNIHKALYWWVKAAKNGNADAQYNLGVIYTAGHGAIKPDLHKALKWWRMAAINGDAVAQFNLGALYANGIGMSSRTCEASRWWKKSAENGFSLAQMALAVLETKNDHAICP